MRGGMELDAEYVGLRVLSASAAGSAGVTQGHHRYDAQDRLHRVSPNAVRWAVCQANRSGVHRVDAAAVGTEHPQPNDHNHPAAAK